MMEDCTWMETAPPNRTAKSWNPHLQQGKLGPTVQFDQCLSVTSVVRAAAVSEHLSSAMSRRRQREHVPVSRTLRWQSARERMDC